MMPRESGQNRCLFVAVAVASLWHNKLTNLSASLFEIRGPMTGHWIHPPVSLPVGCLCIYVGVCGRCPFRCCQSCRINNKRTRMLYSCQPKHSSPIAAAPLPSFLVLCPQNHGRPNDATQVVECCCCQPAVHCIT